MESSTSDSFTHTTLGRTGLSVHRLGLSTTYRPGRAAVHAAVDEGVNFFFGFGIDGQMMSVMRDLLPGRRDQFVIATGPYNLIAGHTSVRGTLERRLRQLRTDYIDVLLFLGVLKENEFPPAVSDEMCRLREEGKVRAIGLSTHNRKLAGQVALNGDVDVVMVRYNAAHRGAESEVFPFVYKNDTGVVSYTATRWRDLLRRPHSWPRERPVADAGMCYRFVLSHPSVHVCLTAPTNIRQLRENLGALARGPLDADESAFMTEFGDAVYRRNRWFM